MVVVVYEAFLCHVLCQLASRHWGSFKTGIYAGLVQCQWIKGSEHSNIWKDRHVVSPWQSQLGDTSTIREIWKFGRPSTTAWYIQPYGSLTARLQCHCQRQWHRSCRHPGSGRSYAVFLIHMHFSGSFIKDQTTVGTFFLTFAAAFT